MKFSPSRKEATDFNGGKRYRNHIDSPSAEDFNNVIEGLLKVQDDIEQNSMAIEFVGGVTDNLSNTSQYLLKNVSKISDGLSVVEKRVDNLYARTFPEIDVIDNAVAYSKVVPEGALPYAEVAKVGGMSYRSENLIPTNKLTTRQNNGVTFTVENGVITTSGMASGSSAATYDFPEFSLPKGTYTLSGGPRGSSGETYQFWCNVGNQYIYAIEDEGKSFTIEQTETVRLYFYCYENVSVNGLVVRPMLNQGSTALPYSPYFEGLRHAKVTAVKSVGANLCKSINPANNTTVSDGVVKQIEADSASYVSAKVVTYANGTLEVNTPTPVLEPQRAFITFEKTNATELCFGVNGSRIDTTVIMDISHLPKGTYTISADFTSITQGSISFRDIMLNPGSSARPYRPYMESSLPIPSAVQALPDYGLGISATVNNHVDWSERKYRHPCSVVDMGTLDWVYKADVGYFIGINHGMKTNSHVLCPIYETAKSFSSEDFDHKDKVILGFWSTDPQAVNVRDTAYTDAASFKAAMSGVMLVYELATPDEPTDISHLLPEDNLIPVEGGGQIVAENEHGLAAPTTINYQVN